MLLQTTSEPDILEVIADLSNDEVFTPPKVASAVLDLLPDEVWKNPDLRWLDPGCKTGVFLREVTRRLLAGLKDVITDEEARREHILTNMVFGVAITELTGLMARRTVYCSKDAAGPHSVVKFPTSDGNIWINRVEHDYDGGRCRECGAAASQMERDNRENHAYAFIHAAGRKALGESMQLKFDVIVGNPPYQIDAESGNRTMPLYQLFVQHAMKLNPRYIAMIIPSRWMAGGLGLGEFRAAMLNDRSIRHIVDYPNASEVFPGVDIKGGVGYFMWDRDNPGSCAVTMHRAGTTIGPVERNLSDYDVLVRDHRAIEILEKVRALGEPSMTTIVSSKRPFGLTTNFLGSPKQTKNADVVLYRSGGTAWVQRAQVSSHAEWIDEWKVLIPKAGPGNSGGHVIPDMVLGRPQVAPPGSCSTETFILVGPLAGEAQCLSLASYMLTRFFRLLVSLRKVSQDAPKGTYEWVPQQSWDREWTDAELFTKYGITAEEQAYISEMIREMPA
jgi:site-specific DNA-methyltransferase (adenine-specific)